MFELISIVLAIISAVQLLGGFEYVKKNKSLLAQKDQQLNEMIQNMEKLALFKNGINQLIENDIKNPLLSIQTYICSSNDIATKKILIPIERMVQLVRNVLNIEELKMSKLKMDLKPVLLSDLLIQSKVSMEQVLRDKSIELKVVLENDCQLFVNSTTIIDVFSNLLNNAIRFAPSHSEITITGKYINDDSSKALVLSFSSKGCTFLDEIKPEVLDNYWQTQVEHSGIKAATALSYAYCKLATLAHDGKMCVTSENKNETTISLELPIDKLLGEAFGGFDEAKSDIDLKFDDALRLKSFVDKLKQYKVYRVASILQIINDIESMGFKIKWLEELKVSVYYSNEEKYKKLLKIAELQLPL